MLNQNKGKRGVWATETWEAGWPISPRWHRLCRQRAAPTPGCSGTGRICPSPQTWWHRDWLKPVVFSACPVVATSLSVVAPSPMSLLVPSLLVQRAPSVSPHSCLGAIRGLTRVSQVGAVWARILLGCVYSLSFPFSPVLYIGEGGAGESLPPLARPCAAVTACPQEKLGFSVLPSCSRPGWDGGGVAAFPSWRGR